jgi:hypothetical protein
VTAQADAAIRTLNETTAVAVGVRPARDVTRIVGSRRYLHGGPPFALSEITGPTRGALIGALVFEGDAADIEEATRIVDAGDVEISSCNHAGGVGAVAGIVTPSMPVVVVEDAFGSQSFAPVNEGLGKVLRYGAYDDETLRRLRWLRDVAAPILDDALDRIGGVDITAMQAEGLRRGDECHNRNIASTANLCLALAPGMLRGAADVNDAVDVLEFATGNPHFFLSFSIAAAKRIADATQVCGSPGVVTSITANGRDLAIRVSGFDDRWFRTPAPVGQPKLFEGFELADANPVCGDSGITETIGIGACALSAAPAIMQFIGGDPREASMLVDEMRELCRGESDRFLIPADGFRGTPMGIDVTKVAATGRAPLVNLGIAHREPGIGQIGAGLAWLPIEPFVDAAAALEASCLTGAVG